jgi:hypothetical protein
MIATGALVAEVLRLSETAGSMVLAVVRHIAENISTSSDWPSETETMAT